MKRSKSLYSLSHDHHQGLRLAQLIKRNAPLYKNLPASTEGKINYTIQFYNENLLSHFKDEEEILYKLAEGKNKGLDTLFNEIIEEHKQISLMIERLKDSTDKEQMLDELGKLLENHIRKEEKQLFPLVEEILSEEELERISFILNYTNDIH